MRGILLAAICLCSIISATAQSSGDYRSRQSGDWHNAANWQHYNGTSWINATNFPSSADGVITILAGHTITLSTAIIIDQTVVQAGAVLNFNQGYVTNGPDIDLSVYGTVNHNSGNHGNCPSYEIFSGGIYNWNNGQYACNSFYIRTGGVMNFNNAENQQMNGTSIVNDGVINFNGPPGGTARGGLNSINGPASLTNNPGGVINKNNNNYFSIYNANGPGALRFNQNGRLNINGGEFNSSSPLYNEGTISMAEGTTFSLNNLTEFRGTTVLTGSGTLRQNGDFLYLLAAPSGNTAPFEMPSTIRYFFRVGRLSGDRTLRITGTMDWSGGDIINENRLVIAPGATLNIFQEPDNGNGIRPSNTYIVNDGTINWTTTKKINALNGGIINNGTFNIAGTGAFEGSGTRDSLVNNGLIVKTSTGTTLFSDVLANNPGGILKGIGRFDFQFGELRNNGILAPGLSPGAIEISNNGPNPLSNPFSANSVFEVEITGNGGPGIGHDHLLRNQQIVLAGTLRLTAAPGVPAGNYEIIRAGSGTITGSFATTELPSGYSLVVNPDHVLVTIEDPCGEDAVFTTYYRDADGDGYGVTALTMRTCDGPPEGYVANDGDCDDNDNTIYPGGSECAREKFLYRSLQSGSWTELSTWQQSADGASWVAADHFPTFEDSLIVIRSGHTVHTDSYIEMDQVRIEKNAVLRLGNMRLNNGDGDDLIAEGMLQLTGNNYQSADGANMVIQDTLLFTINNAQAIEFHPSVHLLPAAVSAFPMNVEVYGRISQLNLYGNWLNEGNLVLHCSAIQFNGNSLINNGKLTIIGTRLEGTASIQNNGSWHTNITSWGTALEWVFQPDFHNNGLFTVISENLPIRVGFSNLTNQGTMRGIQVWRNNSGTWTGIYDPGIGTHYGLHTSFGTPSPMAADSIGTLNITGRLTAIGMHADISNNRGSDLLRVTGSVQLSQPLTVQEANTVAPGTSFVIIEATESITGTFRSVPEGYQATYLPRSVILTKIGGGLRLFRSRQSGAWRNSTTWEYSTDDIVWQSGEAIPDFNDSTITIRNGHEVTDNQTLDIDQVIIEEGATLRVYNFMLRDAVGIDLECNGRLYITGPSLQIPARSDANILVNGTLHFKIGMLPDLVFTNFRPRLTISHTGTVITQQAQDRSFEFRNAIENDGLFYLQLRGTAFSGLITNNGTMVVDTARNGTGSIFGSGQLFNRGKLYVNSQTGTLTNQTVSVISSPLVNEGTILLQSDSEGDISSRMRFYNLTGPGIIEAKARISIYKPDGSTRQIESRFRPGTGSYYTLENDLPVLHKIDSIGQLKTLLDNVICRGLEIRLRSATEFSSLKVENGQTVADVQPFAGNIRLSGQLKVTEIGTIDAGTPFVIIDAAGTITGQFDELVLPEGYTISYEQKRVLITKLPPETCTVKTTYYRDNDNDGYGNSAITLLACEQTEGWVTIGGDCDDNNATVHPNARELCDGLDNDCDGQVDNGYGAAWFRDADGDGYGNSADIYYGCNPPDGYVAASGDCDDNNKLVYPDASGICIELPGITITGSNRPEGNRGVQNIVFLVSLDKTSDVPIEVQYRTIDGSAKAPEDYLASTGRVTIPAGRREQLFSIPVNGDLTYEANETFEVELYGAVNATIGTTRATGTIENDDPPPVVGMHDTLTYESYRQAVVRIGLSMPAGVPVTVTYETRNGTAMAPADYTAVNNGSVTFAPGEQTKYITIPVVLDNLTEPTEQFRLYLTNATNAMLIDIPSRAGRREARVNIVNGIPSSTGRGLVVHVRPNPSRNQFTIRVESHYIHKISMQVTDDVGRIVETYESIPKEQEFHFGQKLKPGMYYVRIIQGTTREVLTLMKLH